MCPGHNGLLGQDLEGWGSTRFLQGLCLNHEEDTRSPFLYRVTSQMCSAPLDALWCLWDTMSVLLCSRPTSSPAIQCQHHQRPQDKMWSCYQIKIMSPSLQHATPFSRPVTYSLFLIRSYLLFAGSKHTSIDRPRYIAWHMPRNFATSKVLCLHQTVRIQSNGINCATWAGF